MKEIILSCMDRRLNEEMDRHNKGNQIFLRNAGANVSSIMESIVNISNRNDVNKITVYVHDDCKAMALVYDILKHGKTVNGETILDGKVIDSQIMEVLVKPFANENFNTVQELEAINFKKQQESLKKMSEKINCEVKMLLVADLNIPKDASGHEVLVMKPSDVKYKQIMKENMYGYYVIQGEYIDELKSDLAVARRLNLTNYAVVSLKKEDVRENKQNMETLKMRFAKDTNAENVKINLLKLY
jgi:hypothetical protein